MAVCAGQRGGEQVFNFLEKLGHSNCNFNKLFTGDQCAGKVNGLGHQFQKGLDYMYILGVHNLLRPPHTKQAPRIINYMRAPLHVWGCKGLCKPSVYK